MMKTLEELKTMNVTEIQMEMVNANRNFDGDYQTIVENIMVEKEMEMITGKADLAKKSRKDLEDLVLDLAANLKRSEHAEWIVGGYKVIGQLSYATAVRSWLKVWRKEHLIEIAKVLA